MHQKRIQPDALISELAAHVRESVQAAQRGDYGAKQWLCESFPGNTAQFRQIWHGRSETAVNGRKCQSAAK